MRVGDARAVLEKGLAALRGYDVFLRDRTVAEWAKAITWAQFLDAEEVRLRNEEAHEFWSRLSETEKKSLVVEWIALVDGGRELLAPGNRGGVGQGYGPTEALPPSKAQAVASWGARAKAFFARIERLRGQKRVEARTDPRSWDPLSSLKTLGTVLAVGVVGAVVIGVFVAVRARR